MNGTDDADKALMVAVSQSGDESIVDRRLLLESGADVIARRHGRTRAEVNIRFLHSK